MGPFNPMGVRTMSEQFELGFIHGQITGRYASPRQTEIKYPHWTDEEVSTYLNGRQDGVAGDTFRLNLIQQHTN